MNDGHVSKPRRQGWSCRVFARQRRQDPAPSPLAPPAQQPRSRGPVSSRPPGAAVPGAAVPAGVEKLEAGIFLVSRPAGSEAINSAGQGREGAVQEGSRCLIGSGRCAGPAASRGRGFRGR